MICFLMTSDSDDLEQELRRNLELRHELGAVAEGQAPKQDRGIAYRLGWVLYWACLAVIALYWAWWAVRLIGTDWNDWTFFPGLLGVPALLLYGLGRAFRYVLSGQ
jgi:hypothetical protein